MLNPYIAELLPYTPGGRGDELERKYNIKKIVQLSSNENPFLLPPNVTAAIKDEISRVGFYPDTNSFSLKNRIAEYNQVEFENIVIGAGLVEVIKMIIRAFLKPGEKVLTSEKSFILYRIATIEHGGGKAYVEARMNGDYRLDLDEIYQLIDKQTKIIIITNPNNPTGTMLAKEKILDFINKVPEDKIIVMDNAYHEYVSNPDDYLDGLDLAATRKNVIVLRTFSKIYALAGLRVGYAVSNPEIISHLNLVKSPFSVTNVGQRAALVSLEDDDFKNKSAALNIKNREKLINQLKDLGMRVIPSETNFLFFVPGVDTFKLSEKLIREGVIVRPLHAYGAPEGMRVTVAFEEDNDFFVKKLKKVLQEFK